MISASKSENHCYLHTMLPRSVPYGRCPPVVASSPIDPTVVVFSHFPSSSSSSDATNNSDNNNIRSSSSSRGCTCLVPLFRLSRSGGGRLSPLNASVEREKEEEREEEEEEEEEETGFEIDRQKAREALRKLDRQLQSLSQPESLPKKRPPPALPELNLDRDMITGRVIEEMPEMSGSYIAYTAVALVILTIFNNIMFNLFIKPTVDGNEQVTKIERVPLREPK